MTSLEQLVSYTNYAHSRNVAKISRLLAIRYGYSQSEADAIEQAALFHDIGKNSVPPGILNKPGRLTPEEYEIVKTHTSAGHTQIMEAIRLLEIAAAVAKEHHERLDGSGYLLMPGSDINPYVRLISVADVFDALVSRRPYKEPQSISEALQYLGENSDSFDAGIVSCLACEVDILRPLYKNCDVSK